MTVGLTDPKPMILSEFDFDGQRALETLIAASSYRSLSQAVASLAVFSHPDTVRATGSQPVIRVVRNAARRGDIELREGQLVGLDDNKAPTDVFLWCNAFRRRPVDVQFNHLYADSQDPDSYANLANLCVTPSFLAKLTDTHPEIRELLRYRAFDLYGWYPRRAGEPREPNRYNGLNWAPPLPPVSNVGPLFEAAMARRPRDRTTLFAKQLGHAFNGFCPQERAEDD